MTKGQDQISSRNFRKNRKAKTHRYATPQIGQKGTRKSLHTAELKRSLGFKFGQYFVVRF